MVPIFKICSRSLWSDAENHGVFQGAPVDLADGYIHFSTAGQVKETTRRHFSGQEDLIIVAFDADALGSELRWEASRGGELFPHLYGPLAASAAIAIADLPLSAGGQHLFPSHGPFVGIAS